MQRRSFDVFDTLLTRVSGGPSSVFRVCAGRLPGVTPEHVETEVYVAAREQAARDVQREGLQDGLAAIHAALARRLGLDGAFAAAALALEVEVEIEVSRAVPGALRRVARARTKTGGSVLFLSDTPLPEPVLVRLLDAQGLWRPGDVVFGSADRGASKEAGGLFHLVAADLEGAQRPVHEGDDPVSDVARARMAGWGAVHAPRGRQTRYERLLERDPAASGGLGQALAGAGRLARLAARERGVPAAMADVAAGVGAPLLIGYCLWLLQRAAEAGCSRLYFCSRDGEVLLRVAQPLADKLGLDLTCSYLYGSSAAWQLPALVATSGPGPSSELLRLDATHRSPRQLLARTGLSPSEAAALSDAPWFRPPDCDRLLPPDEQAQLAEVLLEGEVGAAVLARAEQQRDLLVRYLRQEGVLGGEGPVTVVDVGWLGRVSRALEDVVVHAEGASDLRYSYVGLFGGAEAVAGPDAAQRQEAWLFDEDRGLPRPAGLPDIGLLVEAFCASLHGRTLSYRAADGLVVPVLAEGSGALEAWGQPQLRAVIDDVVAAFVSDTTAPAQQHIDLRPAVTRVLTAFWATPTLEEARTWGAMPFDLDKAGGAQATLGRALSLAALRESSAREGRLALRPAQSWRRGSLTASALPWRWAVGGLDAVGSGRRRLSELRDRASRARHLRRG